MARPVSDPDLPMAPMVALFVLLVVFMIQFYAATETLTLSADTVLPASTSTELFEPAAQIEVTADYITLEGVRVANVRELGGSNLEIEGLREGLTRLRERTERIAAGNTTVAFEGKVLLLGDKRTKYDTITRIMYTSGLAGYGKINMIVTAGQ
jgi:biopolymer transport protein ExbD